VCNLSTDLHRDVYHSPLHTQRPIMVPT